MWVFSETGFVSAVRHRDLPGSLMVRGRDRISLEPLAALAGAEIKVTPDGDYPYRVSVPDQVFTGWMTDLVTKLDYDNFKSRVAKSRGYDFAHPLHQVWDAMHGVEDEEAIEARQ